MIVRLSSYIFSFCLTVALLAGSCQQVQAAPKFSQKVPIHIEANKMTSLEKKRAVVFSGDVKAKQGELLINSDEMTVYHAEQGEEKGSTPGQPQIKKMHAKGHVEIVQDDFVATGDEAEYFSNTGKVIVTGNAKIIQNNNMITGHKVEMDLSEGSTVIIPDEKKKGRVKGYFYPANTDKKNEPEGAVTIGTTQEAPAEQQKQDAGHGDTGN
ncbi:MAG: lipopolysaccharide transport periplasmic protein LptA [Thermodesulfobacteriota bacterium]